jgi:thioredoxin-like negative regulator of GroEL
MDAVWTQLAALHVHEGIRFLKVEAEAVPSVSEKYELSVVPTFVLLEAGQKVAVIEGADPPVLAKQVQAFAASKPAAPASDADAAATSDLTGRLSRVSYYRCTASLNMHTSCLRYCDSQLC